MNEITELIANTLRIEDIISETVKLRPASRGYVGLCPFHREDTPSFHVYTDTQSYYCFGCQRGGNIFTYIMEKEHVSFSETLQILSDRSGIRLPDRKGQARIKNTYDILKLTEEFFAERLRTSNPALAYLKKREITDTDIKTYGLGYAPESWDALTLYLRKHGINDRAIIDSGLAIQSKTGLYDRFRGRIIFPVHDVTGKTIAFGGRIIAGEGAKYINSPESEIYRKRRNLYLLDKAKNAIREKKRSILCEGYMDAIRLQKLGFHESVASLGTSLTQEQAEMLSRYADRCYICYDSDSAGQNAAIRGMYILQSHGLDVRVISLPDGKDPDEYLLGHSANEFEELITNANPLIVAHIESLRERLEDTSTRKSAFKELFASLETLKASEVLEYKFQICEACHMLPSELEGMLGSNESAIEAALPTKQSEYHDDSLECGLCALLMKDEKYRMSISPEQAMNMMTNPDVRDLALSILNENVDVLRLRWLQTGDTEKMSMIERGEILCREMRVMNDDDKFRTICCALKRDEIDRKIEAINAMPMQERDMQGLIMLYQERAKYQR